MTANPRPNHVVILAAGRGTRLGGAAPKPLTLLADGRTILARQLDHVRATFGAVPVTLVVGHAAEQVTAASPGCRHLRNDQYAETNTAKSLLVAFEALQGSILWMNGDVVTHPDLLRATWTRQRGWKSFAVVQEGPVGSEEVGYRLKDDRITAIGKQLPEAAGEAVGINYVTAADRSAVLAELRAAPADAFFEQALDACIRAGKLNLEAAPVGALYALEVDFPSDLTVANRLITERH